MQPFSFFFISEYICIYPLYGGFSSYQCIYLYTYYKEVSLLISLYTCIPSIQRFPSFKQVSLLICVHTCLPTIQRFPSLLVYILVYPLYRGFSPYQCIYLYTQYIEVSLLISVYTFIHSIQRFFSLLVYILVYLL